MVRTLRGAVVCNQVGRGATQQDCRAGEPSQGDRNVPGVVGGQGDGVVLFVRGVVGFIEDNEAQAGDGRKESRSGANDHVRFSLAHPVPDCVALAKAELAVHYGDAARKASFETADGLGCQADLGHEDNGPAAGSQRGFQCTHIDFGLARARDPMQEGNKGLFFFFLSLCFLHAGVLLDYLPDRLLVGRQAWWGFGTRGERAIVLLGVEADQSVVGQIAERR